MKNKFRSWKDVHYWKNEYINDLKENYSYYIEHKEEAENKFQKRWSNIVMKARQLKISPMKLNKKCSLFLGCHIAERVLSHVFKDVERMKPRNIGFDFICNKGFKIDVKASCLHKNNTYTFRITYNKTADYFLLIVFNNRKDLNPQHIWLIKNDEIIINEKKLNEFNTLSIPNTKYGLSKYSKYELIDKLKETIECCNTLKEENTTKEIKEEK